MLNLKNHRNPVWFSLKLFLTVGVFVFPTSQGTIENNEFNKDIQSRSRFISKYQLYIILDNILSTILSNTICITKCIAMYHLYYPLPNVLPITFIIPTFDTNKHIYSQL